MLLQTRCGSLVQNRFPGLVAAAEQFPPGLVLDGEVLVWDAEASRPSFEGLQRGAAARSRTAPVLAACLAAYFVAFDVRRPPRGHADRGLSHGPVTPTVRRPGTAHDAPSQTPGGPMCVRTAITTGAAVALLLAITGCSNDAGTPTAPSTSAAPASSTAPTPSPTPKAPRAFGAPLSTINSENQSAASVTVLGYEQGIKVHRTADEEFGTSGYVWAAIEVKVCSTKGTVGVTRNPWALAYTDGARIEPSSVTYDDFPRPEYPWEADIKNGDCLRGKTVFAAPGNLRPARVLYTSSVLPEPAEWAVPPQ